MDCIGQIDQNGPGTETDLLWFSGTESGENISSGYMDFAVSSHRISHYLNYFCHLMDFHLRVESHYTKLQPT